MRISKIQTRKLKGFFKRLLWAMAEKAFLTFLVLLFIALIFGTIIYYQYNALAERTELQIAKEPLQFQQKTYENVLKAWQKREREFNEAGLKEFPELPKASQEEATPEESSGSPENIQEEIIPEESSTSTEID